MSYLLDEDLAFPDSPVVSLTGDEQATLHLLGQLARLRGMLSGSGPGAKLRASAGLRAAIDEAVEELGWGD